MCFFCMEPPAWLFCMVVVHTRVLLGSIRPSCIHCCLSGRGPPPGRPRPLAFTPPPPNPADGGPRSGAGPAPQLGFGSCRTVLAQEGGKGVQAEEGWSQVQCPPPVMLQEYPESRMLHLFEKVGRRFV